MKAFEVKNPQEINQEILSMIKEAELEVNQERQKENKPFIGATKLVNQGIDLDYRSKRSGKKMWCLSGNREKRKTYINWGKNLASEAYDVYCGWCRGDTSRRMPLGMFSPCMPVVANLVFLD